NRLRTFVAIELPPSVQETLRAVQVQVQEQLARHNAARVIRWTPVEKVHLTLRFLGDTSTEQSARLAAELRKAAAGWQAFSLQVDKLGCFPNFRQPSVVWVGVQGQLAALAQVQAEIEAMVQRLGFAAEER